jgi:hypothetical protein
MGKTILVPGGASSGNGAADKRTAARNRSLGEDGQEGIEKEKSKEKKGKDVDLPAAPK